jgi:hypothetical protein
MKRLEMRQGLVRQENKEIPLPFKIVYNSKVTNNNFGFLNEQR